MHNHEGKEKGAGGPPVGARKKRKDAGPSAASLNDFILRLHVFCRDWQQVLTDAELGATMMPLIGMLDELAAVLKHEYDIRHGQ